MIKDNFLESAKLLDEFIANSENFNKIEAAAKLMIKSINNGGKIISCGNGGSMCDAMHFAEELSGRFKENRKALPAIAISDPSHITCVANDYGFDFVFSRFIEALGNKNDVLLAISTSGNSKNIINAIKSAKEKNMIVVALTGKDGGEIKNICDIEIRVPHFAYSDRIQEIHIKIIHSIIDYIEKNIGK
ncbi:MAG: D-sedoheptulose 7-phosphate isomerase [Bacteroidales bacterium]|nr:D-sedoheptulose 7-phosphate isomerase [Bacteroidales bacterium]MDY0313855.1 D-sedoheptulose 7-phosphate isomerase [Bacteroidales bacterium]